MSEKAIKTLANCKPSEFLVQTNKIRKSVAKWLSITDIQGIRKRMPDNLKNIEDKEERDKALLKQSKQNLSAILDEVLEKHPTETLEVLALCAFVEPKDVDNYPISFYLQVFNDLINDEAVQSFFISLLKLGNSNILI